MNFESLKHPEIVPELGRRVAYYGPRLVLARDLKQARACKPMNPTNVGEREVSTVIDVQVDIKSFGQTRSEMRVVESRSTSGLANIPNPTPIKRNQGNMPKILGKYYR